jgi:glycosyltransferase involved in cell wall biosynthesis
VERIAVILADAPTGKAALQISSQDDVTSRLVLDNFSRTCEVHVLYTPEFENIADKIKASLETFLSSEKKIHMVACSATHAYDQDHVSPEKMKEQSGDGYICAVTRALSINPEYILCPRPIEKITREFVNASSIGKSRAQVSSLDARDTKSHSTDQKYQPKKALKKRKIAWLSPLPPEESGVADYSYDVTEHFSSEVDVTLVHPDQNSLIPDGCELISPSQFMCSYNQFDQIFYNIGNSPFHTFVYLLALKIPGIIILHDVFIGHLMNHMCEDSNTSIYNHALNDGGASALRSTTGLPEILDKMPLFQELVDVSEHIVVHSNSAKKILMKFYPGTPEQLITEMPLPRFNINAATDRSSARNQLGISKDELIISTFGFVNKYKGVDILLEALETIQKHQLINTRLFVVGAMPDQTLANQLKHKAQKISRKIHVKFFDRVTTEKYSLILSATDVAVQLRTKSHGETSAAVLDCLQAGIPTIVNAELGFSEIPDSAIYKVDRNVSPELIGRALLELKLNTKLRHQIGTGAMKHFRDSHQLKAKRVLDGMFRSNKKSLPVSAYSVASSIKTIFPSGHQSDSAKLASIISHSVATYRRPRRLCIDVSVINELDLGTGIQRVVNSVINELLKIDDRNIRVIPVTLDSPTTSSKNCCGYKIATNYLERTLNAPGILQEEFVQFSASDCLICLDLAGSRLVEAHDSGIFRHIQSLGTTVIGVIYDLLPISHPEVFPEGTKRHHERWFEVVTTFDGALCISEHVAKEAMRMLPLYSNSRSKLIPDKILSWVLGSTLPELGTEQLPSRSSVLIDKIADKPGTTFLMVGTIEPRKAYDQVLDAFELLWDEGCDLQLVIVGREGWTHLPDDQRRSIPHTIKRLKQLEKTSENFLWLSDASDEELSYAYKRADWTICASIDEGFGLPVVEAANHGCAVLARDIAVFQEIAPSCCRLIHWDSTSQLSDHIRELQPMDGALINEEIKATACLSWQQSAEAFLSAINQLQSFAPPRHISKSTL